MLILLQATAMWDLWHRVILILEFMSQHLHIDESEVPRMCLELYREHGTTMAGLKVMYLVLDFYYYYYCYFFRTNWKSQYQISGCWLWVWQWWVSCFCPRKITLRKAEAWSSIKKPSTFHATAKNSMSNSDLFRFNREVPLNCTITGRF